MTCRPFEPPLRLTAFEYRDEMKGGMTRPVLVAAFDEEGHEHKVVLKVRNPDVPTGHFGPTSLTCELVCSVVARSAGIPVPDYAIVTVTPQMVSTISDSRVRRLLTNNLGENFGCRYHPGFALWTTAMVATTASARRVFEDIYSFDAAVLNGDRTGDKPNLLFKGSETLAIDHSLALFAHIIPVDQWTTYVLPDDRLARHVTLGSLAGRNLPFDRLLDSISGVPSDVF